MELLALAVVLLAPVNAAILTNVIGVIAYVAITGEFLVQFPISSPEVLRLELVSILLLALLYLLLLQRHQATMRARETRQTISRLMRVQSLANIGYFVLDTQTGEVRVDDVAAGILGTAPRFAIATILQRVPPADRAGIGAEADDAGGPERAIDGVGAAAGVDVVRAAAEIDDVGAGAGADTLQAGTR